MLAGSVEGERPEGGKDLLEEWPHQRDGGLVGRGYDGAVDLEERKAGQGCPPGRCKGDAHLVSPERGGAYSWSLERVDSVVMQVMGKRYRW